MKKVRSNFQIKGSLAIAISAILWAVDGVLLTPRLYNLNVSFVVFLLHLLPFLIMSIFFAKEFRLLKTMSFSDFKYFFLVSLFGGALGTLSIVKSLFLMDFNHLSVIVLLQKLQPVFAIALARILLKEQIKKHFALWAGIAIVAGYFLTFGWSLPDFSTNGINTLYAALFSILAAFSFGSSTVFSKKILGNYSFVASTFYRYFFTTLIMLVIVIVGGHIVDFGLVTSTNWLFLVLIGLTTGSGAIFLYYYGLRKVTAMMSTIIELLYPITALVLDWVINKTILSPVQWIAAIVMLFAIVKLNVRSKEKSDIKKNSYIAELKHK